MRCYRRLLGIKHYDHVRNEEVRKKIQQAIGPHDDLLIVVKKHKMKWYGHVSHSTALQKQFYKEQSKEAANEEGSQRGARTTSESEQG